MGMTPYVYVIGYGLFFGLLQLSVSDSCVPEQRCAHPQDPR